MKRCYYFSYFLTVSTSEFREEEHKYKQKEEFGSLDPIATGLLTKAEAGLLKFVQTLNEASEHKLMIGTNVKNSVLNLLEELNNQMMLDSYMNGEDFEETIDLTDVSRGLPQHLVYLINRVITSADLFAFKFRKDLDGEVLKSWDYLHNRINAIKRRLLKTGIIWQEKNK